MKTVKIKTCELIGPALDLAISTAENPPGKNGWGWFEFDNKGFLFDPLNECRYSPSTNWAQGGPIIDREWDNLLRRFHLNSSSELGDMWPEYILNGEPTLVAFMRCFVASKLGDVVEIPEELK